MSFKIIPEAKIAEFEHIRQYGNSRSRGVDIYVRKSELPTREQPNKVPPEIYLELCRTKKQIRVTPIVELKPREATAAFYKVAHVLESLAR